MTLSKINAGRYTTTIQDLEDLGWDFDYVYSEVAKALDIEEEEAEKYEKENYNVVITVSESGSTEFYMESDSETSDVAPTGDDKQTIKDIEMLLSSDKIINFVKN